MASSSMTIASGLEVNCPEVSGPEPRTVTLSSQVGIAAAALRSTNLYAALILARRGSGFRAGEVFWAKEEIELTDDDLEE